MKMLLPAPPDRTPDQIENHYLVEKAIADRLKNSSRDERKSIHATMYNELFKLVPDHPRLIGRGDEGLVHDANAKKLALIKRSLESSTVFIEFAAGDCRFAIEVAQHVKAVYAIDISDQRGSGVASPDNFSLVIYDGYNLNDLDGGIADVIFSDQFIEHLHPEDTESHFILAYHLLKPGGRYIFRTPHAFGGPHDVSRYFSHIAQGFHLKEWTYSEIIRLLNNLSYSPIQPMRLTRGIYRILPRRVVTGLEALLSALPWNYKRLLAQRLFPSICIAAFKPVTNK